MLDTLVRARYPVIQIVTQEENRVSRLITAWLKNHNQVRVQKEQAEKDLLWWTMTTGVRSEADLSKMLSPTPDPIAALQFFAKYGEGTDKDSKGAPAIMIMKDIEPYYKDPRTIRALRDCIASLTSKPRTIILISSELKIPAACKRQIAVIEWSLPTIEELTNILDLFIKQLKFQNIDTELNGDREQVAKALAGLTEFQAQSVLSTAVISTGKLDGEAVEFIIREKARLVKESGLLEFFQPDDKLAKIGGLDNLRGYLRKRQEAFSEKAKAFGLPAPKGIMMVGIPGCGKSLAAKTLAGLWKLPLMRLDVGSLMGSLVGQSEQNLNRALQVAESAAPCILWLDELEKGFSGVKSSGRSDGGTTARVFAKFLTWMQEKTAPVYIVATCNDIQALPPELMRAGRFDDIFFVDLPNRTERKEIWEIHISKVGRDPANYSIEALVEQSEGYTGSEIEVSVADGLYTAFDESSELKTSHLVAAINERVPLLKTMETEINNLREWAKGKAKPASSSDQQQVTGEQEFLALEM